MRFENRDNLKLYYEDVVHSDAREQLFSACDPKISDLYQLLDGTTDKDKRALVYQAIEAAASHFVVRADYVEHEDLDWIIEHEDRIPFKLPT